MNYNVSICFRVVLGDPCGRGCHRQVEIHGAGVSVHDQNSDNRVFTPGPLACLTTKNKDMEGIFAAITSWGSGKSFCGDQFGTSNGWILSMLLTHEY